MAYSPRNPNGQDTMSDSSPVVIASDQSAVPVSASSLPLPTGAATSALQTQPGVDIGDVTVNNASGASAVNIQDGGNSITVDGTVTANLAAGTNNIGDVDVLTINGVAPAFGTGLRGATVQRVTIATDDLVPVSASSLPLPTGAATLAEQQTQTTSLQLLDNAVSGTGFNISQVNGESVDVGAGTEAAAIRVTLPTNGTGILAGVTTVTTLTGTTTLTPGTGATNLGKAEDAAHTSGDTGVMALAVRTDTPAVSSGTTGDYEPLHISAEGAVYATNIPTTAGGLSVANFNTGDTYTALTNSAQVIKASAGNLYGYYIYNPNATATYVMLYNIAAASVTVGTSTPLMVFCIPATAGANLMFTHPISFSNAGWSIAAATTGGGNTAPASALECMIWYK